MAVEGGGPPLGGARAQTLGARTEVRLSQVGGSKPGWRAPLDPRQVAAQVSHSDPFPASGLGGREPGPGRLRGWEAIIWCSSPRGSRGRPGDKRATGSAVSSAGCSRPELPAGPAPTPPLRGPAHLAQLPLHKRRGLGAPLEGALEGGGGLPAPSLTALPPGPAVHPDAQPPVFLNPCLAPPRRPRCAPDQFPDQGPPWGLPPILVTLSPVCV